MHAHNQKTPAEQLAEFPIVFTLPVQWGDQDSFGHVNNVMYLRWCESARIVYLEESGITAMHRETGIGPILASITCNFRQPVVYPDRVQVGARVTRLGNSSFQMDHILVSDALGVVADSTSTIVIYDYANARTVRIPDPVRAAIAAIEARADSSRALEY